MRRVSLIAAALLVGAATANVSAYAHHACLSYGGKYYDLLTDGSTTNLDRYNGQTFERRESYAAFHMPAPGTNTWDEGVGFAATMQTRNAWLNNEPTSRATWDFDAQTGEDTWTWWTTVNGQPVTFVFKTSNCRGGPPTPAPPPNCLAFQSQSGATCADNQDCCGAGTIFPQCINKGSGDHCCIHYKGAATCHSDQTCCGEYGPGASSSAFCCGAGTSCCQASSSTQGATCCPSGTTCCSAGSIGVCCAADEVCNPSFNRCDTISSPPPTRPGEHRACLVYNGKYYDLDSDPSGTSLERFVGTTFENRQLYGPFNMMPPAGTNTWDEGVGFAATMQTRNAWLYTAQTSRATWDHNAQTGEDTWTWYNTESQVPIVFKTSNCRAGTVNPSNNN
jgi:hypothetical protein